LKLETQLDVVKYSLWVQKLFARGLQGHRATDVNLGPLIISETNRGRKLKLKTLLDVVNYSLLVQKFLR